MDLFWLEQSLADVRTEGDWLSADEAARIGSLCIPKRREDWRLGRWTAKNAVAAHLDLPLKPSTLAAIEILPAASGAPEVFFDNKPALVSISLSHRAGRAACAVAPAGTMVGCDLEFVEPRCDAFVADYFTAQEQQLVARASKADRFRILALLWSAKESTLKALRAGLRLDPRCIAVDLHEPFATGAQAAVSASACESRLLRRIWRPARTHFEEQIFQGWWQCEGDFVRTLVSAPASAPPVIVEIASAGFTPK